MKKIDLGYIHMETWNKKHNLFPDTYVNPKTLLPNEIVLPSNRTYMLTIDYPLDMPFRTKVKTGKNGITRIKVIELVIRYYKKIYMEETTSSKIKPRLGKDGGNAPLLNRNHTDGKYGIWGHELKDLVLHTLYVDEKKETLTVDCDS